MAKVVVIDDSPMTTLRLGDVAIECGHTVLCVCANSQSSVSGSLVPHLDLISSDVDEIRLKVLEFQPDFILLDHNLELPFNGEDLAKVLGIGSEKLIGTSSVFEQKYCLKKFRGNKESPGEMERKNLQEIIG